MPPVNPRHGVHPSLWLLPDEDSQLVPVLAALAEAYSGPRFVPHLTLLGSIPGGELVARSASLAARLSPMMLPTGPVLKSTRWFRCLTLTIPLSSVLQSARDAAADAFGVPARPWLPHISLLYGDLRADQTARITEGLPTLPTAVRFSTLVLAATIGPTEAWSELGRWRLQ
ncbi:MAG: hypothetical protein P8R54_03130 [Myxococcota bacterium]|nr:hypothetical protein [Myxococcota bacterium]